MGLLAANDSELLTLQAIETFALPLDFDPVQVQPLIIRVELEGQLRSILHAVGGENPANDASISLGRPGVHLLIV